MRLTKIAFGCKIDKHDVVKKQKYDTLGSRMIKASDYKKPDTPSNDGNTEGM